VLLHHKLLVVVDMVDRELPAPVVLLHLDLVAAVVLVDLVALAVPKEMMVVMVTVVITLEMELPVEVVVLDKQDKITNPTQMEVEVDMVDMVFKHHLPLEIQILQLVLVTPVDMGRLLMELQINQVLIGSLVVAVVLDKIILA
jgi:hypothetical protein